MNFVDDDLAAGKGTLHPLVGQTIHLTDIGQYNLDGFRLSWRSDNTARVSAIEPPEIPGATRCCRWATCRVAEYCCAGKPHKPDRTADGRNQCYDHRPYVDGGVTTWGILANAPRDLRGDSRVTVHADVGTSGGNV